MTEGLVEGELGRRQWQLVVMGSRTEGLVEGVGAPKEEKETQIKGVVQTNGRQEADVLVTKQISHIT